MELIAFGLALTFVVALAERRERKEMFPPGPCGHCDMGVHVQGDHWVHDDGSQYARYPTLDYDLTPDLPLHPATPRHHLS